MKEDAVGLTDSIKYKQWTINTEEHDHGYNPIKSLALYLEQAGISLLDIVTEINIERAERKKTAPFVVTRMKAPDMYKLPYYNEETNERLCRKCGKTYPFTNKFFYTSKRRNKYIRLELDCKNCRIKQIKEKQKEMSNYVR